ncbi:hypothetical protein BDR26DRAFT_980667, partial [Obelidium mucronatum]
ERRAALECGRVRAPPALAAAAAAAAARAPAPRLVRVGVDFFDGVERRQPAASPRAPGSRPNKLGLVGVDALCAVARRARLHRHKLQLFAAEPRRRAAAVCLNERRWRLGIQGSAARGLCRSHSIRRQSLAFKLSPNNCHCTNNNNNNNTSSSLRQLLRQKGCGPLQQLLLSLHSTHSPSVGSTTTHLQQQQHQQQKTFPCLFPGCFKVFPRAYNLKSHSYCHSGERPHQCSACNASFSRKHDLQRTCSNGIHAFFLVLFFLRWEESGESEQEISIFSLIIHSYTEKGGTSLVRLVPRVLLPTT